MLPDVFVDVESRPADPPWANVDAQQFGETLKANGWREVPVTTGSPGTVRYVNSSGASYTVRPPNPAKPGGYKVFSAYYNPGGGLDQTLKIRLGYPILPTVR